MPRTGDWAPDFHLPDSSGTLHSLSGFRGKNVVVYFYPKDDTPGCTIESCDFSKEKPVFDEKNSLVIGISADDEKSHQTFIDKYRLSHLLLSDTSKSVLQAYGVWQEKRLYGQSHWGIVRTTFLIGPDGRIRKVWDKVIPIGHAADVLKALD
jgi:peroxiredoxin Q/BCP